MVFQTMCLVLAIYVSVDLVERFDLNKNQTSMEIKMYSVDDQDKYPVFSICFKGAQFRRYQRLIYDAFGLSKVEYENMLKGEKAFTYEYCPKSRAFRKIETNLSNGPYADFENFHLKTHDFLVETNMTYLDSSHNFNSFLRKNFSSNIRVLHGLQLRINYQSPDMICFARDASYISNSTRLEDSLRLSRDLFVTDEKSEIQIFIHHRGQLIRYLDNPIFTSSFADYEHHKILLFRLSQSSIVIRRHNYIEACDKEINNDYDGHLMHDVINEIKCMPLYWRKVIELNFPEIWQDVHDIEYCTSHEKLAIAYERTTHWTQVMQKRNKPCVEMLNIIGWNWLDVHEESSDEAQVRFHYDDQHYQELIYERAYDFEILVSNIGGFVAIFLGYCMMQFPTILGNILRATMGLIPLVIKLLICTNSIRKCIILKLHVSLSILVWNTRYCNCPTIELGSYCWNLP